jgi:hypothetical protein
MLLDSVRTRGAVQLGGQFLLPAFLVTAALMGTSLCLGATPKMITNSQKSKIPRVMFGLTLRPEMARWVNDIEKRFGLRLKTEVGEIRSERGNLAQASFGKDGNIYIDIDISVDLKDHDLVEALLAHELLHLVLRTRGFPHLVLSAKGSNVPINHGFTEIAQQVSEGIDHWLFKTEIVRLGLGRAFDSNKESEALLDDYRRLGLQGAPDSVFFSIRYFRGVLEYSPKLLKEMTSTYEKNRWLLSIKRGNLIARTVKRANIKTPQQMINTYIRCLNLFFDGNVEFTALSDEQGFPYANVFRLVMVSANDGRRQPKP